MRKSKLVLSAHRAAAFATAVLAVIPVALVLSCAHPARRAAEAAAPADAPEAQTAQSACSVKNEASGYDGCVSVRLLTQNGTYSLPLDAYLRGVLYAEMPPDFPDEALRAQTVAARTFVLRTMVSGAHGGAVCDDSACCQAYLDEQALHEALGDDFDADMERAARIVRSTDGVVASYHGRLIDAVYFSCSGGRTEDASAVWGGDVAYLRSVDSPGEEAAAHYFDVTEVPLEAFCETILMAAPEADLTGTPDTWIGETQYTAGGGVASISIGGAAFSGTQLRALFSLRSAAFSVAVGEKSVAFETSGYGHRVGMSQYGASAMADAGASFSDILTHYYTGITLKTLRK